MKTNTMKSATTATKTKDTRLWQESTRQTLTQ